VTYEAIFDTNLLDPLVRGLFVVRELPARLLGRLRGRSSPTTPRSITMRDLATPEAGMVVLAEEPGIEFVVGSVGRFWEPDYGHIDVSPEEFTSFAERGRV